MTSDVSHNQLKTAVTTAINEHGIDVEDLIPILLDVNNSLGFLPTQAIAEVSNFLHIPISKVYSVASFYKLLSLEPRGKHIIQHCESAPCHVMGGNTSLKTIQQILGIKPGETSSNGNWTLILTSCLGICGVGPVMIIDDTIFGNFSFQELPQILAQYE